MSTAAPDRPPALPVLDVPSPYDARSRAAGGVRPDRLEVARLLGLGLGAGLGLLRGTADLGLRLALLRDLPRALPRGSRARADGEPAVTLRRGGVDLSVADLDAAFPHASARLLVLLGPPGETEDAWSVGEHTPTYAAQLARLLGWTPVHLRTDEAPAAGLGPLLSGLLQRVVDDWPVPVERVALLGLGDGGLVLRAACAVRPLDRTRAWPDLVTDLVALGSPHLAVPVAKGASAVGLGLDERLAGLTTDEVAEPGIVPLPHVRHVVVQAAPRGHRAVGRLVGGLLWWRHRLPSRPRRAGELFPTAARFEVDVAAAPLAQHPEVAAALLEWLA